MAVIGGALSELTKPYNWEQVGTMTPDEAAELMTSILLGYYNSECGDSDVPTPYWDEDTDVDDHEPADMQNWYGYVTDPEAAPGELTFFENAAIWAMTGFLAVATWEVGAAPAILFHTIAPRFTLAMRRGDVGEIIRILVDGEEAARVDTSSAAPGEVVRAPIVGDPTLSTHELMIVQVS